MNREGLPRFCLRGMFLRCSLSEISAFRFVMKRCSLIEQSGARKSVTSESAPYPLSQSHFCISSKHRPWPLHSLRCAHAPLEAAIFNSPAKQVNASSCMIVIEKAPHNMHKKGLNTFLFFRPTPAHNGARLGLLQNQGPRDCCERVSFLLSAPPPARGLQCNRKA